MRQDSNITRLAEYVLRKRDEPMQFTKFARHVAHIYYAKKDITEKNQKSVEGVLVDARQAGKFRTIKDGNRAFWGLPEWPAAKFGQVQTYINDKKPVVAPVIQPRHEVHVRCPCCDTDVTVSWTKRN